MEFFQQEYWSGLPSPPPGDLPNSRKESAYPVSPALQADCLPLSHSENESQSQSEVAQSCPTLCNPMDCSLPGFSVHGIFQARVLSHKGSPISRYVTTNTSLPRYWRLINHWKPLICSVHQKFLLGIYHYISCYIIQIKFIIANICHILICACMISS